jgi:hypothetical protein
MFVLVVRSPSLLTIDDWLCQFNFGVYEKLDVGREKLD